MIIISLPGCCGQKSFIKWLASFWKKAKDLLPTEAGIYGVSVHRQGLTYGQTLWESTACENLPSGGQWEEENGTCMWGNTLMKKCWKTELRFAGGINVKQGPLERTILKRNEKYIKLCLIYGIYRLLTSKYKVLFPWSSLSLMYYLSVNVVHSEHNSYGNISVPTAALLHPWNSVIFKFPHC